MRFRRGFLAETRPEGQIQVTQFGVEYKAESIRVFPAYLNPVASRTTRAILSNLGVEKTFEITRTFTGNLKNNNLEPLTTRSWEMFLQYFDLSRAFEKATPDVAGIFVEKGSVGTIILSGEELGAVGNVVNPYRDALKTEESPDRPLTIKVDRNSTIPQNSTFFNELLRPVRVSHQQTHEIVMHTGSWVFEFLEHLSRYEGQRYIVDSIEIHIDPFDNTAEWTFKVINP